ncbi:MAG: hypothetical protein CMI81_03540 [Candidatus Pelagibacter sp.]|nr:hypothetical protein [Candidatus Pelagibacter sp.]|tara:strand:- start:311 stop:1177 length:867 start_codon:yes stop_codon:yes gene_type:complete
MINIVCTSKPGDGLLRYSYEHCSYLNSINIQSQLIIIPHRKFTKQDYIESIAEQYITPYEPIIFNNYIPKKNEITLIMGRSMLTLPYLSKKDYSEDQLFTLHLLFRQKLISVYSENHPKDYDLALKYFASKRVYNLCDKEIYVNGVGTQFEKMINFSIYKPIKNNIKYKYLFLGTNEVYYKEIMKVIDKYPSHVIIAYDENYIDKNKNNIFVPVKNLLGLFETYVYTKSYFDPAPRIIQECKWLGKNIIYLRDKNIKDGGPVYMKRPVPTKQIYKDNINILVDLIKKI